MVCCSKISNDEEATMTDINKHRHCTDIIWFLLVIASFVFTFALLVLSKQAGANPNRLIHGSDLNGDICGHDDLVKDKPNIVHPYLPEYKAMVCVKDCSQTKTNQPSIMYDPYESTNFLNWCFPRSLSNNWSTEMGASQVVADIWGIKVEILSSAFVALFLSVVYMHFIKKFAGCLVWFAILVMIVSGIALGSLSLYRAENADQNVTDDKVKGLRVLGVIFIVGTFIICVILFSMRKSIFLAIKVVKVSAKALEQIPTLLIYPVVPTVSAILYFGLWIVVAMYIMSVGSLEKQATPKKVYTDISGIANSNPQVMQAWVPDVNYRGWLWPHLFNGLFALQFIIYFSYMVIAGAVADWYFTSNDNKGKKIKGKGQSEMSPTPVLSSMFRTTRYHLGSVALGALIIAIIKFIRVVLAYIHEKVLDKKNVVQRCFYCIVQCILKCLECCIDKINKNSYIWMAITGDSFCKSACRSFSLLWKHLGHVAAINTVAFYLLVLGRFSVTFSTTAFFAFIFSTMEGNQISSIFFSTLIVLVLSFAIAKVVLLILEAVIDTTFLCYLMDVDRNGAGGIMLAGPELTELVEKHKEKSFEKHESYKEILGKS